LLLSELAAGEVVIGDAARPAGALDPRPSQRLAAITAKKAGFKSIGDTWADTTTSQGRLMLTVLGGLAEFERDLIRARTGDGRARAVARGQRMGRPPKLTPHQQREAIKRRDKGEESLAEIGRSYNVSAVTISRLRVLGALSKALPR
jgi:DNA invertase Pin-like site-specific DNA recombinase